MVFTWWPYLCPKLILWDFSSIRIQTFPIVSVLQYGRRSREWKPFIGWLLHYTENTMRSVTMKVQHLHKLKQKHRTVTFAVFPDTISLVTMFRLFQKRLNFSVLELRQTWYVNVIQPLVAWMWYNHQYNSIPV